MNGQGVVLDAVYSCFMVKLHGIHGIHGIHGPESHHGNSMHSGNHQNPMHWWWLMSIPQDQPRTTRCWGRASENMVTESWRSRKDQGQQSEASKCWYTKRTCIMHISVVSQDLIRREGSKREQEEWGIARCDQIFNCQETKQPPIFQITPAFLFCSLMYFVKHCLALSWICRDSWPWHFWSLPLSSVQLIHKESWPFWHFILPELFSIGMLRPAGRRKWQTCDLHPWNIIARTIPSH